MLLILFLSFISFLFFFFNDTATTEIYTLSLHDALPIWRSGWPTSPAPRPRWCSPPDRKSTRLNSSHVEISYAVFCLKKKKKTHCILTTNNKRTEQTKRLFKSNEY